MNPITATALTTRRRASRARRVFQSEVLTGLGKASKQLPCKYFYDARGSGLFDRICQLDEHYLTRSELAIMDRHASEMGVQIGSGVMLVDYGSGSRVKTRYLLDALPDAVAYVGVDVSGEHLQQAARELVPDIYRPFFEVAAPAAAAGRAH
jgi:uncharacterized SAM-dependent methyltransferase